MQRVMDAERYQALKSIFAEALALTAGSRTAFLDEVCDGDAELRAAAEQLLAAERSEGFMAQPALHTEAAAVPDLGRGYRVLRELARGGMGVVYLAQRDDGEYRGEVAVKVLTAAAALHPEAIARLRLERQILAQLNHPHIARLYDGGTTATGLPYLVMEYVDGARIDDYARTHELGVDARLALFLDVCAAVSYAHTNLIVHRDLKPSNILVTADGAPKLLDFGIAKPLQNAAAALTQEGGQMLTPRYASPEQLRGETVTTSSDVYSLGVVLYELLSGESPYGAAVSTPHALAKAICDTEPPAPSTQRGTPAAHVAPAARALRGDLDAILLKALHKQPAQRYASVDAFADDLRHHRAGLPVAARSGAMMYRVRKFARRHWLGLSAAAAVIALSIAFVIGLAWQLERTRIERDKAEQIVAFMGDLFRVADPSESRGNTLTVREALDRGAVRLAVSDAHLPDSVRGSLLDVVGRVYQHLGLLSKAEPLLVQARELRAGAAPDERTSAAIALAELRLDQGKFKESKEILAPLATEFRGADAVAARLHLVLGQAQLRLGEREAAQTSLEHALNETSTHFGAESLPSAEVLSALANVARERGDNDAALGYFRRTLAIRERLSDDPWLLAKVRNNLGLLLIDRGDYAGAEPLLQQSLDGMRGVLGEEHPLVAAALGNFASLLQRRGNCAGAQPLLERAYALRQKLLGADNGLTGVAQGNLGYGLFCLGRFAEAEQEYDSALAVERKALGNDNIYTLAIVRNLAALHFAQGHLDQAEQGYRDTLALGGAARAGQPLLIQARAHLGQVLRYRGNAAAALFEIDAAALSQRKLLAATHPDMAEIELLRADALLANGVPADIADACARAQAARNVIAKNLPETYADRAYATAVVATCADRGQATAPSHEERRRALDALVQRYGAAHPLVIAQREHLL